MNLVVVIVFNVVLLGVFRIMLMLSRKK